MKTDTRTLKQVAKAVSQLRRKVAAAVRRHEKLQQRISKLQAEGRIVSMHKDAEIVAGDNEWYVKAESLNTNPDAEWNWYYILTCDDEHGYDCRCESVKPCKHIEKLSEHFHAEALAVSERLQAELVLHQAEQFSKAIEPVMTYVQKGTLYHVRYEDEAAGKLVSVPVGTVDLQPQEWEDWRKEMVAYMHEQDEAEKRATAVLNSRNQGFSLLRA